MKKKFYFHFNLWFFSNLFFTDSASIDEKVNEILAPVSNFVASIVFLQ